MFCKVGMCSLGTTILSCELYFSRGRDHEAQAQGHHFHSYYLGNSNSSIDPIVVAFFNYFRSIALS